MPPRPVVGSQHRRTTADHTCVSHLTDLKRYISLVEQGTSTVTERRGIMRDQHDRITRQIRELRLALETTEYKIRVYDGHPEG
ncbi:hypothetical protein [Micromonospora arida]|uniref:hypothetical protein n=1 Tax=Micromonospora arida TaxID=2203715 RepID=UPI00339EC42F